MEKYVLKTSLIENLEVVFYYIHNPPHARSLSEALE